MLTTTDPVPKIYGVIKRTDELKLNTQALRRDFYIVLFSDYYPGCTYNLAIARSSNNPNIII